MADGKLTSKKPGNLPLQSQALAAMHVAVQGLAIRGVMEGDIDRIYQACILDPVLSSQLDIDNIVQLVDELFSAQGYNIEEVGESLRAFGSE